MLVYLVYGFCIAGQVAKSGGIANPIQAIAIAIWERVSYDFIYRPNPQTDPSDQTFYQYNKLGRYMWIYTLAPLAAGIAAGAVANYHLKMTNSNAKLYA